MEKALKLKANIERFFYEKAVDYGLNPEEEISLLQEIDYQKLVQAIENQRRPLRGYTGFVAHKWRHDCSYHGNYHPKSTLLIRVLESKEEAELKSADYEYWYKDACSRKYMELWVDRNMDLLVVSCAQCETPDDYFEADYITQYREILGAKWPDEHNQINLNELGHILIGKANRTAEYNQTAMYIPLRGEEGLLYKLHQVKNAGL